MPDPKSPAQRAAERIAVLMAHPEDGEPTAACIAAIIAEEYRGIVAQLDIADGVADRVANIDGVMLRTALYEIRSALGAEGGAK